MLFIWLWERLLLFISEDALLLALEGRDLIEEKNRQIGRTRNIGYELR